MLRPLQQIAEMAARRRANSRAMSGLLRSGSPSLKADPLAGPTRREWIAIGSLALFADTFEYSIYREFEAAAFGCHSTGGIP